MARRVHAALPVTTGSDSGFIYKLYGFDYIRELELLREAGFHPLEVIRAATYHGALQIHKPKGLGVGELEYGILRPGMKADLVVVEENPLENLKVLYGTGAVRLNDETGEGERVGGVKYTIKAWPRTGRRAPWNPRAVPTSFRRPDARSPLPPPPRTPWSPCRSGVTPPS